MKNNKVLIIGASGHAKVIIDIIEKEGKYEIFGLIDSFKKKGEKIFNYTILGTEKDLINIIKTNAIFGSIIAIGDNWARKKMIKKLSAMSINLKFITAIHPNAIIGKNVVINYGTAIMPGTIINSNAIIGKHCIINTKSSIGHDTIIKDFCSIAPGVTIAGAVSINTCSAVSLGANIIESIKIGKHSVIGAGSLVNKNIGDYKLAYGVPVKEISDRKKNDKYLDMKNTHKSLNYSLEFHNVSNQQDEERYNSVLQEFSNSNIFYSLQYCNYCDDSDLSYFVLRKNGEIKVLMPICFHKINLPTLDNIPLYDVSSPYGYSGPLFNNTSDQDIKTFWSKVDKWYKKNNIVTEFIRFNLENNHLHYSGHLIPSLSNIKGVISDFATLWVNLKQKVRNNYRKAEKNLLTFEINTGLISQEIIDDFYHIYIKTMERNAATKNFFYPKSYFENLIKYNENKVLIAIVNKGNTPISVEFIINNEDILYSYLGGTLSEYFETRPNDFLKIEVIKWAIKNNKSYYVLGGGRKDFDGLYQYKKAYFPKDNDVIFYTGRKIINEKIYYDLLKNIEVEYTDTNSLLLNSNKYFPIYNEVKNSNDKINELRIITSKVEWQEVLKHVDNYDFYHTYDYHNLSKTKDEKAILIKYTEGNILIALPLIIRKIGDSKYFDGTSVYGYAGPLQINVNNAFNNRNFVQALEQFFKEENIISIFSRLNPYIDNQHLILEKFGEIEDLGNVVNIDITKDIDFQRTQYSKSTKSRVNKARKQCYIKQVNTENEINEFIDIYYENMKRLNAKDSYFFDRKYFLDFYNSKDFKTTILMVFDNETNKAIAAAMFVITNDIIQFHLSGTKNDSLNIAPARLFIDEMRLIGTKEGCKFYNLGGGLGSETDSLFDFKASFSNDYKSFKVWKYIVNKEIYNKLAIEQELTDDVDFFPLYRYQK